MANAAIAKMRQARKDFIAASKGNIGGDLAYTQSQLNAIFHNLGTTGAGIRGALTASQQRDYAAIARMVSQGTKQSRQSLKKAEAQAVNRYGTALGPAIETAMAPAKATAGATGTAAQAAKQGAHILGKGAQLALSIQQAGVQEAQAGAEYAASQAATIRYQADAAIAAQMQFDLQMRRLDYRLAAKAAEDQAALAGEDEQLKMDALAEAQMENPDFYAGMTIAASSAARAFPEMQRLFWKTNPETGAYLYNSASEVANAFIESSGVEPGSPQAQFIQAIAAAMYSAGAGPDASGQTSTDPAVRQQMTLDAIMETLLAMSPQFRAQADEFRSYLEASSDAAFSLWAAGAINAAGQSSPQSDPARYLDPSSF